MKCINCENDDLEYGNLDIVDNVVRQSVFCFVCDIEYDNVYKYVGIASNNEEIANLVQG